MAATPEQNRRYQAGLRRVLKRFHDEQPDLYRHWLTEALNDVDRAWQTAEAADKQEQT